MRCRLDCVVVGALGALGALGLMALMGCTAPSTPTEAAATASAIEMPDFLLEQQPRAQVLLLGVFHFRDAGLDDHQPVHGFDALSEQRQQEIAEVLDKLEAFQPTAIAVEMNATRQEVLNERYADYIDNPGDLGANEIYQLGFRLGRRLGHRQLHAVDARGRSFFADMTDEEYEAAVADLLKNVPPERIAAEEQWDQRFSEMYTWEDELIDRQTLAEHLVFSNDPAILRRHHGHYLVGEIKLGRGDNYLGADLKTRWYNRNLRIFSNIQRIIDRPNDRVVVIIGSGHVPILRHAFLASPEYALVEVRDVL